jgi:putative ABC transport system permease protein
VDVIMRRLADTYPESNRDKGLVLTEMQEAFAEFFRPTLLMLMGAIVLVLLIACGNVASLLLARGSGRRTEMAMRSALGAGGGRLVRQLLTESAVLGLAAGLLGTIVALSLQRSLVASTPLTRMGLRAAGLQPEILLFAVALSVATVLIFGLVPALAAGRVDPADDLKAGARSVASGGRARFRNALVVAQVALSVVLLVGAGLLLKSFVQLRGVDPGFVTENVLTADIGLPRAKYEDDESRLRFFTELQDRVGATPGVLGVGFISRLPIRDPGGNIAAWDPANPPADASEWRLAYARMVMPGYFEAMSIPMREGRDFMAIDAGGPSVMVISEAMARTIFPDQSPLGRQVAIDTGDEPARFEVVGVVGDVQISSLSGDVSMVMYIPYSQWSEATMRLAVRTSGDPRAIIEVVRATLREMDPDIPLAGVATMDEVLSRSVSFQRTVMSALGLFAGVALFLAALGLYGVLAYYVAQRNREIGIRMAMGATGRDVFKMVLSRGFVLVGIGLIIGIGAAVGAGRLIRTLLFRVEASDPTTLVSISLFFVLVALLACLIPAWRAWRIDPVVAFRSE